MIHTPPARLARRVFVVGLFWVLAGCDARPPLKTPWAQGSTESIVPVRLGGGVGMVLPDESTLRQQYDRDGDRIDDRLPGLDSAGGSAVTVEVALRRPTTARDLQIFSSLGGRVQHVFEHVSHGFSGAIEPAALAPLAQQLGEALMIVGAMSPLHLHMDEATRCGRVRPLWRDGFAGTSGLTGKGTTIAIVDTGVDSTHLDLQGRMAGWRDYTEPSVGPQDPGGHGTAVASVALGSGAAFGTGPGRLSYTHSASQLNVPRGDFKASAIHTPGYFTGAVDLRFSASATFPVGVQGIVRGVMANENASWLSMVASDPGDSPLDLIGQDIVSSRTRFSTALTRVGNTDPVPFAINAHVEDYPGVGDGFNALSGVAPGARWFSSRVFDTRGGGTNEAQLAAALDDVVALRETHNIRVVNISLGVARPSPLIRAKINTAVNHGLFIVVSAGNDGPGPGVVDPARAAKALTVGATDDFNAVTDYSSAGVVVEADDEDQKPDVVAPGGGSGTSNILCADSNQAELGSLGLKDIEPDDYANLRGTSFAAPFVSGVAALLIEAYEGTGRTWDFHSDQSALFIKTMLAASASETNQARKGAPGGHPSVGRSRAPKDINEGYGIVNPDAAVAAMLTHLQSPWREGTGDDRPAWRARVWGRHVDLLPDALLQLNLRVPDEGDFDLYVYTGQHDDKGNPAIWTASDHSAMGGQETLSLQSDRAQRVYVFVKRVLGQGGFELTGSWKVLEGADAGAGDGSERDGGGSLFLDAGGPFDGGAVAKAKEDPLNVVGADAAAAPDMGIATGAPGPLDGSLVEGAAPSRKIAGGGGCSLSGRGSGLGALGWMCLAMLLHLSKFALHCRRWNPSSPSKT